MTIHLSARLAWHDRGWDGRVCDAPHLNASCIVHQHIRDSRDDDKERRVAGTPFAELKGWLPPCSRDPGAYADKGYIVLGTLLRALDMGPLKRLILVGDPYQLPPIGPWRPFVDIIKWLQDKHLECLAPLAVCMRKSDEEGTTPDDSMGLALAEGYRGDAASPADDEVLSSVARGEVRGDLEVVFWQDRDDLRAKLKEKMHAVLGFVEGDYNGFNNSLGINTKEWKQCEAWQILCPTRVQHSGTDDLNRMIQLEYRAGLIKQAVNPRSDVPRPFGDYEIVYSDKVIQAWPRNTGIDYVANGEIGIVHRTVKGSKGDYLDVAFSTQPEVSYRYSRGAVNGNLELAYALTVHKAQGSDFDVVFLIIPQMASTLSRELIYTGLTRFRRHLVLLIDVNVNRKATHRDDRKATRPRSDLGVLATQALLEAVAVAVELQHMAAVGQAVQERPRKALIPKDLPPATELQVGGDEQAAPQIAVSTHLEEQAGPLSGEGDEADLVQDEQVQLLQLRHALAESVLLLGLHQLIDEPCGGHEAHPLALPARQELPERLHIEALIHRTRKGIAVRSKSEVVVAEVLDSLGISWEYEQPLYSRTNPRDFRLPDFTVSYESDIFYWEHLGMLTVPTYREAWERKREWYKANGSADRLIVSADGPDGSIDAGEIERIAREHIRLG